MGHRFPWLRLRAGVGFQALSHWFQTNTLAPARLPQRWRQPLFGYPLAAVLTMLAVALELAVVHIFPTIDEIGGFFLFLVILFLGLNWGAGPCLLATILSTTMLAVLLYPPLFAITRKDVVDLLQDGLVLCGGLLLTYTLIQRERHRRAAEQRAIEAERERHRLRAVLETLLAMVAALVQTPQATPPVGTTVPAEDLVARRLVELISYALGCQQVSLFSLDSETEGLALLGAVDHSPTQMQPWGTPLNQQFSSPTWLDAGLMARLYAGEVGQVEVPSPSPQGGVPLSRSTRLLVVPIQRDTTLLGLLTLDRPLTTTQAPAEDLALVQAMARLIALVLERERLVQERELARAAALALAEAKRHMEVFLGIASHELKTPLTTMLLGLQVTQRHLQRVVTLPTGTVADEGRKLLALLRQDLGGVFLQSKRLERLVDELLESSRIEAGHLELHRERTDLAALVRTAVEEQHVLTPDRTIHLHELPTPLVLVSADPLRIGQVLGNYLSNALKYSAEDRPVEVGVWLEGQQALVWVQDDGPGIPVTEHDCLWERFYRVPGIASMSGSGVGLGLGLYISRAIIEQHQGQVGVQSAPGHGSRFWFTLPIQTPEEEVQQGDV